MGEHNQPETTENWDAATWDGARREALRRWAALPLEKIIAAQEEMQELATALGHDIHPRSTGPVNQF